MVTKLPSKPQINVRTLTMSSGALKRGAIGAEDLPTYSSKEARRSQVSSLFSVSRILPAQLSSAHAGSKRLFRHLAVASVSLLLVLSGVSYVFASTKEALAAAVASVSSRGGHESIEGRFQGAPSRHVTIEVISRLRGKQFVLRRMTLGRNGRFNIAVKPGHYTLVIIDGAKRVTESLIVRSGHSEFVVVEVTHHSTGFGLAPVIFNY